MASNQCSRKMQHEKQFIRAIRWRPEYFRFADIDEFRSSVRNISVDFTPLVRTISAEQIIVNLPGCDVNFTKSFPRIVDVQLAANCTIVGFSMDDGAPIRIQRRRARPDTAYYDRRERGGLQRSRNRAETIRLHHLQARGRRTGAGRAPVRISTSSKQARLRTRHCAVWSRQILAAASEHRRPAWRSAAFPPRCGNPCWPRSTPPSPRLIRRDGPDHANSLRAVQDIPGRRGGAVRAMLATSSTARISLRSIGVSVRTMNEAVHRYRGMSLHRYLRCGGSGSCGGNLSPAPKASRPPRWPMASGIWAISRTVTASNLARRPSETLAKSQRTAIRCRSRTSS